MKKTLKKVWALGGLSTVALATTIAVPLALTSCSSQSTEVAKPDTNNSTKPQNPSQPSPEKPTTPNIGNSKPSQPVNPNPDHQGDQPSTDSNKPVTKPEQTPEDKPTTPTPEVPVNNLKVSLEVPQATVNKPVTLTANVTNADVKNCFFTWYYNTNGKWTLINNVTTQTLTIPAKDVTNSLVTAEFRVSVTEKSTGNQASSEPIKINVQETTPEENWFSVTLSTNPVKENTTATITANVTNLALDQCEFQWSYSQNGKDWRVISDANKQTLTIESKYVVASNKSVLFRVKVTNKTTLWNVTTQPISLNIEQTTITPPEHQENTPSSGQGSENQNQGDDPNVVPPSVKPEEGQSTTPANPKPEGSDQKPGVVPPVKPTPESPEVQTPEQKLNNFVQNVTSTKWTLDYLNNNVPQWMTYGDYPAPSNWLDKPQDSYPCSAEMKSAFCKYFNLDSSSLKNLTINLETQCSKPNTTGKVIAKLTYTVQTPSNTQPITGSIDVPLAVNLFTPTCATQDEFNSWAQNWTITNIMWLNWQKPVCNLTNLWNDPSNGVNVLMGDQVLTKIYYMLGMKWMTYIKTPSQPATASINEIYNILTGTVDASKWIDSGYSNVPMNKELTFNINIPGTIFSSKDFMLTAMNGSTISITQNKETGNYTLKLTVLNLRGLKHGQNITNLPIPTPNHPMTPPWEATTQKN